MVDKEIDKLGELQQELKAMQELKADEDIIQLQKNKIKKQEAKIVKLLKTVSNS